jgi:hypothetical protein
LDRGDADATGRAGDEHEVRRPHVGLLEHVPRGEVGGRQRRGLAEADRFGEGNQAAGVDGSLLGEGAVEQHELLTEGFGPLPAELTLPTGLVRTQQDAVARFQSVYVVADFAHDAGSVEAGDERQRTLRNHRGVALQNPEVVAVDRAGTNVDDGFVGGRRRVRALL